MTELLVVIMIMALLAGIILPAVNTTRKNAAIARQKADLNSIVMALTQYANDFRGYYPKSGLLPTGRPNGDRVLARALIGPLDAPVDGADGPGFRAVPNGKIWPPYLATDHFKLSPDKLDILDTFGNPIEYFPRRDPPPAFGVAPVVNLVRMVGDGQVAMYDTLDGTTETAKRDILARDLRWNLGDANMSNRIDANEQLRSTAPFILYSRGPDGLIAPSDAGNVNLIKDSDDIYTIE